MLSSLMKKIFFTISFGLITLLSLAQRNAIKRTTGYKKIAGIELGSKGVKLSILERNINDNTDVRFLKDSSVNTDFINFSSASFETTSVAYAGLYNYVITNWQIPSADIATVISSGVKAQADKLNKQNHLRTFIDAFRIKINEDDKFVEVVDVLKESMLSHYGIITNENRYNTFLIDIGSGNTKGGYFKKDTKEFVMFQIPSGTKSTFNLTEKKCATGCDIKFFKNNLTQVVDSLEKSEIIYAVNASGAYPSSTTMALSGGIAWAVATMLYPEKKEHASIEVTYKDVVRFKDYLIKNEAIIADTSKLVVKGVTGDDLNKIRNEVKKVLNVFDAKTLLSGTSLMLKIMRQFESSNSFKNFKLIKNGQVGWITGYILNNGDISKAK
jgi:hypothetical protein